MHLALPTGLGALHRVPDTLHRRFAAHAPRLARKAAEVALSRAGLVASDIDAVIVSTCTGYLCPGLRGYISERLSLRADAYGFDLVGRGCAGALPNWQLASALSDSEQGEHVLSSSAEDCFAT
jgi:alkylresorcinol/alkylpyrone synthase